MTDVNLIVARSRIVRAVRAFFDARGFVEVETAVRIAAPAPEEHIDCPPCRDGGYLRASPELQMKKLLAAGMDKIYQIGPCFRDGERGSRHSPEFTMIEWYRRNATYRDIAEDLKELLVSLKSEATDYTDFHELRLKAASCPSRLSRPSCRPDGCPVKTTTLSVRDAYLRFAGWDPWQGEWDQDRFDFDMATKVEPAIREMGGGVFLVDYPPQAASLAKVTDGVAERWEFYWNGMELANCFTELCDEAEQRRRFAAAKAARAELGESDYPIDEEFLACLPRIGSAAGVALGVDRLVMTLTGAANIASVRASV